MRLGLEADIEVVGEAADGEAALKMTHLLAPNVVVMDVQMPIMDGIAATAELHQSKAHPAVVILSLYDDERTRARANEAGADAFVSKDCMTECLSDAIRSAASSHVGTHTRG
jgi:DNA-binding NarL/FixJ family response regulator